MTYASPLLFLRSTPYSPLPIALAARIPSFTTCGGMAFSGTLSTPQYTMCPLTEAWILKVTDGIVYLQAYRSSPFRTPTRQSYRLSMYCWATIQSESRMNRRATWKKPVISFTFSTRSENDVDGSLTMMGEPSSSKRRVTRSTERSFFDRNTVFGIETPIFIRWEYMLTLSEQIRIDAGSSMTGMPWNAAICAATYVTFIGSVLARMKSASIFGIFVISTGKMKSTEWPMPSATSRQWIRAVSCSALARVFLSTKMPSLLIGTPGGRGTQ
ncbi:MAG: hypothetical protein A4E34_01210 [Methanoregula sp. PtaU1.Bin006]|nr:MAG: hypothetical protein A4E34_01210 [Methanoregula sp. PtaU1.Bin006]